MPQITSCPECSRKLRVPDDLIGKKVKCPGCTTLFIAEADDAQPEAPPAPAPARKRSDAVTAGRKSAPPPEDDEEEEEPQEKKKPRGRRDEPEEEEEEDRGSRRERNGDQRVRSRRDDDGPRARASRDEEDERPRGRRRDEDDEDDDRPARRRRDEDDDYDDDRPQRKGGGWRRVRMGINMVAIGGWVSLSIMGIYLIAGGLMLFFGGGMIGSLFMGGPGVAMGTGGAMLFVMAAVGIVIFLLGLTSLGLLLTGVGFTMSIPKSRRSSMRGMAIAAFSCYATFVGLYLLGMLFGFLALPVAGVLMQLTGALAGFVGHILWMVLLRMIAFHFRDEELAGKILTNLIVQIVTPFVGVLLIIVMSVIIGVGMAATGTSGNAAASFGVGMILGLIMYGVMLLVMLGIYVWYILLLQRTRDLVEYYA